MARVADTVDNHHEECWVAGDCKDNGANYCSWCGMRNGSAMYCCSRDVVYQVGDNCYSADFSLEGGHRCVMIPVQEGGFITPELGLVLAVVGGSLYAVAAALTAFASKAIREEREGWDRQKKLRFELLSALALGNGGVSVTVAYMSGHALALLNALAYACQLILTMQFSMAWGISDYTKTMRVGTTIFSIATVQLSFLAPAPKLIKVSQLMEPEAITFQVIFWTLVLGAMINLPRVSDRSIRDTQKIFSWAIAVTGFGVLTDNWARVMGVLEGPVFYAVATGLVVPGCGLGYMYIRAMSSCDVAVYVPTQLSLQLVANLVGGYYLWGDGTDLDYPVTYIMGYVMILLAVYVASPELDVMAMLKMVQEKRHAGLSKGEGKTQFGKSVLEMIESWNQLRHPFQSDEAEALIHDANESLRNCLKVGVDAGHLQPESLVDLSIQLWMHAANTPDGANSIIEWFAKAPFFRDYFVKDPRFRAALVGAMPEEVREGAVDKLQMMGGVESLEVARFLSVDHSGAKFKDRLPGRGALELQGPRRPSAPATPSMRTARSATHSP